MPSLAPEFENDIFLSYSHADPDGTGETLLKTWSQAFHKELVDELHSLPEWRGAKVYLDEGSVDISEKLEEEIRKAIFGSAILLVLMSPDYLGSQACKKERNWWVDKVKSEPFPEVGSRIFVARIWPLDDGDSWPGELCDEIAQPPIGRWFFDRTEIAINARPFGWPNFHKIDPKFRPPLVALVGDLATRLRELKQSIERKRKAAADAKKLSAAGGQAIYVHARKDDAARWDAVCTTLISAGFGVVPGSPDSFIDSIQSPDIADDSMRALEACDGLIIVPGSNSNHLASDLVIVGRRRRNSARATSNKPLPCAVLDQGLLGSAKERHQHSARNMHIEWIDATSPAWTQEVQAWLNANGGG
jgi:TIR domain